jgi:rare lipoprotein A (peptidoglycan hydrolase)
MPISGKKIIATDTGTKSAMTKNISRFFLTAIICAAVAAPVQALSSPGTMLAAKGGSSAETKKNFSGNVSWYGEPFNGKKTASGKLFDMNKCTSAHLHLPFFTRVLVEDPKSGKSVIVTVLDRGPYVKTRVMDLARGAAKELGTLGKGVAYVDCTVLDDSDQGDSK